MSLTAVDVSMVVVVTTDNGVEVAPSTYLLQRGQGDVQVAHGGLWEALGVLALFEEGEATTGFLAVVSHLQYTQPARVLFCTSW